MDQQLIQSSCKRCKKSFPIKSFARHAEYNADCKQAYSPQEIEDLKKHSREVAAAKKKLKAAARYQRKKVELAAKYQEKKAELAAKYQEKKPELAAKYQEKKPQIAKKYQEKKSLIAQSYDKAERAKNIKEKGLKLPKDTINQKELKTIRRKKLIWLKSTE